MATLGNLTLKLRSTRKLLALDLLQSRQEIEQWRQSMDSLLDLKAGVTIDWDSFSRAESEIRRWVDSLPKTDLQVGARFVGADLNENLKELERLLANPLKILVDDKRLFELNEHFKLKERDYKQLQNVLTSPLEIKVDRSQLDNLSRDLRSIENTPQVNLRANVDLDSLRTFHEQLNRYSQGRTLELATSVSRTTLNALQSDLKALASNLTTARVSVQIDSQLQALRSELGNLPNVTVGVSIDDSALAGFDRRLGNRNLGLGVNPSDISNIDGHINKLGKKLDGLKPASGLFKAITFAPVQLATGFFQGVGRNLSNGLGKGYSQGIEAALGDTIGSTELLGRKLAEGIANRAKSSIAQLVPTAITDALRESINQALGESEVFVESRSRQAIASKGQRKKKDQSREGIAEERRQAARDLEDRGFEVAALTTRSNQLERSYQANSRVKNIVDDKIASRPESSRSRAKLEAISAGFDFDQNAITEEQIRVGKQLRSSRNAQEQAQRRVDRSDAVYQSLKPTQLPKAYRDAIADVPENLIPQLKADPKLAQRGMDASYSAKLNRLKVSPEIYQSMQDGSMTQDQFRIMYHEIQHGRDFKFGQFSGLVDRDNLEVRNPVKATTQEIRDVAPYIAGYKPELRAVEQNAEIAGRRQGKKAYEQQQRQTLSNQLTNVYGLGGIKLDRVVNNQVTDIASRAVAIDNFGANLGYQSPSADNIVDRAITLRSRQKQIGLDIAKASNGELSSAEIEELQSRIDKQVAGIEHLSTRIDALKRSIVKRVAKAKQAIPQPVETTVADPWATSKSEGVVIDRDKVVEVAATAGQALRQTLNTGKSIISGVRSGAANIALGAKSGYGLMQQGEAMLMNASPQARLLKSQIQTNIGDRIDDARYQISSRVNSAGQFAGFVYQGLKAAESVPLGLLPGGYTAKKVIQNIAAPAALYSAAHAVPGLNMMLDAASGGIHTLAGGAGNLLSSGATSGMANFVSQALGSVPFHETVVPAIQQGLGAAMNATITGGAETAATIAAPVLLGKSLGNAATGSIGFGLQKLGKANPLLQSAQTPSRLKPAEPEYEYVEVQPAAKAVEATIVTTSASQNAASTPQKIPEKKQESKPVEIAPPKLITQITETEAIDRAKNLAQGFVKAQKAIKKALKKGELELAFGMSKQIETYAQRATSEIASITSLLGDDAAFGTKLGSQLANAKSQITKARNTGIRAATVYKNSNLTANSNGDELASLSNSGKEPDLFGGIFSQDDLEKYAQYQQQESSGRSPKLTKEQKAAYRQRTKSVNKIIGSASTQDNLALAKEFLSSTDAPDLGISNRAFLSGELSKTIQQQETKIQSDRYTAKIDSQRYADKQKKGQTTPEEDRRRIQLEADSQREIAALEQRIKNNRELLGSLNTITSPAATVTPAVVSPTSLPIRAVPPKPIASSNFETYQKNMADWLRSDRTTPAPAPPPIQPPTPNTPLGRPLPPPTQPPTPNTPLGRPLPPPTQPPTPNTPLGRPLPPPAQIIPELAARSLNPDDLIASIEQKLRYFDGVYPQAEKQVRGSENRGRKNTRKFLGSVDRNQDLFDSSFGRLDRESSKNLEEQTAKTQNLNDRVFTENGITPLGNDIDGILPKLGDLKSTGLKILGVFGGFTALSLGVPAIIGLGKATLDTAKNFETLQIKLAAASDSAQSGKRSFERITSKADELGISRSSALEVGAGIAGTTFGTELQGSPSDRITDQTFDFFRLRGLNKQQQEGFQLAATQTLGRKNLSGQEVNQFIQSAGITDTRSIAARGMGLTPAQFAAMQDGPGIDSKKFIQAFLSQGLQDARTSEALASQTASYKESKLSAQTEALAGNIGAIANPAYKAGIDLLRNSIGLLNDAIKNGQSVLIGFAVNGLLLAGKGLIELAIKFGLPSAAIAAFKSITLASAGQIGVSMLKLGAQFAAFYVLGEGIQLLSKKWSNAGQEIQDSADKIGTALDKIGNKKVPDINKPTTASEVQGDNWVDSGTLWVQRNITNKVARKIQQASDFAIDNPASVELRKNLGITAERPEKLIVADNKEKDDRQIRDSIDEVSRRVLESKGASERASRKGKEIIEVDRQLAAIDTERSGLYTSGSPDPIKIAELNKRFTEKTAERDKLNADTAPAKGAAQEAINAVKNAQSFIDGLNEKGKIGQDTYIEKSAQLAKDLKIAEEAQLKLNQAIKSGFDNLTPWINTLNKIATKFEDIGIAANTNREKASIIRNKAEMSGMLTKGQAERYTIVENERATEAEIKVRKSAVKELKDSLNILDKNNVANVQKSYGLDDSSSSAQIKIAAGLATTNSDKQTLDKLAVIKDEQLKIATLDAGLSNSRVETYRRLAAENREAMLYYVNLAKQIDPVGTAFSKAISGITTEKNRLISKLEGFNNGIFDGFTNSIVEMFDAAKRRMEIAKNLASEKKNALDTRIDVGNQRESTRLNSINIEGDPAPTSAPQNAGSVNSTKPTANPVSQGSSAAVPIKQTAPPDPQGYTRSSSGLKAQTNAALARLTPAERKRYLNTTLSVDGKTDLAPDEWDRKYNPSVFRQAKQTNPVSTVTTPIQQNRTVQPTSNPKPAVGTASRNENRPQSATVANSTIRSNQSWVDKQETAANTVYGQTITNAERNAGTLLSEEDLKQMLSGREATRKTRQETKQQASEQRKQQQGVDNLSPAVTIQDSQGRQLRNYDYAGIDKRDEIEERSINFNEKLADYRDILIPNLKSYADGTNPQLQQYSPEDRAKFILLYKQKLKESLQIFKELEKGATFYNSLLSGYDKKLAEGRAKIQVQQKYDLEVAAENVKLGENDTKRTQIDAQRQGIGQQLKTQQFNNELQGEDRKLQEESERISIENEKIRSLRQIEDRKRRGEFDIGRTPAQAAKYEAGLKATVEATAQRKLKSSAENRAQRSNEYEYSVDTEKRGFELSKLQQQATGFDIGSRRQAAIDRIDAPFANNISIDRAYSKKVLDLETEKASIEKVIIEKRKKYANNPDLLASAEAEYIESLKQVELKKATAKTEYEADTSDRERSRRGFEYSQNANIYQGNLNYYSAQIAAKKYRGADTRDEEYALAVANKQKEYQQQIFDLSQQKSQITAVGEAADQQRERIDAMIANLQRLEEIDLSNLGTQFDRMNQVVGETQKATRDVFGEFARTGNFDIGKILRAPLDSGLNQILDKIVPDLFSGLYKQPSKPNNAGVPAALDLGLNSPIFDQIFTPQPQPIPSNQFANLLSQALNNSQQGGGSLVSGLVSGLLGGMFGGKGGTKGGLDLGLLSPIIPGFATGGMVTSPTLALVGEGINNEAIVPLPNGRSIPVDLRGAGESSGNGGINSSVSVTIQNSGQAKETSRSEGANISQLIKGAVMDVLVNERRPGGLLA